MNEDERLYPFMNSIRAEVSCEHGWYTGMKLPFEGEFVRYPLTPGFTEGWYVYFDFINNEVEKVWAFVTDYVYVVGALQSCAFA